MTYDFRAIEARWQSYWDEHSTFRATIDPARPKYYVLDMFPYPSGDGTKLNSEALKKTQVENSGEELLARSNPAVVLIDHPVRQLGAETDDDEFRGTR